MYAVICQTIFYLQVSVKPAFSEMPVSWTVSTFNFWNNNNNNKNNYNSYP